MNEKLSNDFVNTLLDGKYNYVVINDEIDKAVKKIESIILS